MSTEYFHSPEATRTADADEAATMSDSLSAACDSIPLLSVLNSHAAATSSTMSDHAPNMHASSQQSDESLDTFSSMHPLASSPRSNESIADLFAPLDSPPVPTMIFSSSTNMQLPSEMALMDDATMMHSSTSSSSMSSSLMPAAVHSISTSSVGSSSTTTAATTANFNSLTFNNFTSADLAALVADSGSTTESFELKDAGDTIATVYIRKRLVRGGEPVALASAAASAATTSTLTSAKTTQFPTKKSTAATSSSSTAAAAAADASSSTSAYDPDDDLDLIDVSDANRQQVNYNDEGEEEEEEVVEVKNPQQLADEAYARALLKFINGKRKRSKVHYTKRPTAKRK